MWRGGIVSGRRWPRWLRVPTWLKVAYGLYALTALVLFELKTAGFLVVLPVLLLPTVVALGALVILTVLALGSLIVLIGVLSGALPWSSALVWLSLVPFLIAAERYRQRRRVEDTPLSTARGLSIGPACVRGRVEPQGEPLTGPVSGQPCVGYRVRMQIERVGRWWTLYTISRTQPFMVDDGTGRVRVRAHPKLVGPGPSLDLLWPLSRARGLPTIGLFDQEEVEALELGPTDPRPPGTGPWDPSVQGVDGPTAGAHRRRNWLALFTVGLTARQGGLLVENKRLAPHRVVEERIPVGDQAYVCGVARAAEGTPEPENPDNLVLDQQGGGERLLVAEPGPEALARALRAGQLVLIVAGLALFTMVLALLLRGHLLDDGPPSSTDPTGNATRALAAWLISRPARRATPAGPLAPHDVSNGDDDQW